MADNNFRQMEEKSPTVVKRDGDLSSTEIEDEASEAEHKRVRLKVDLRLVVLVGFMYCVSLMDRSNLANANAAGYVSCLHLNLTSHKS
jgi:hypothetical protein